MTQQTLETAGILRRLTAMIYDSMLVFAVLFAATLPAVLMQPQIDNKNNEQVVHELPTLVEGWPFQLYLLVIYLAFFCLFWRKNGQTLGMQAWRLQLQSNNGDRLTIFQCLQRIVFAFISMACLGAGYWWIWIDRDGLSWHDRWSNSRIVVLPKVDKKK